MTGKEFLHERKSLGWTQGKVAKVMGCAVRSVRRWEKGEVRVPQSLETIIALHREVERWRVRAAALKAAGDAIRGLLDITSDYNLDSEQAGRAYAALHDIDTALKGQSK